MRFVVIVRYMFIVQYSYITLLLFDGADYTYLDSVHIFSFPVLL